MGEVKGESVVIDDAIDQTFAGFRIFGKTTQDGVPTPDAPVELVSVENPTIAVNEQSMLVPYTLRGVPVSSGGNYTDANGQQWICDEVDFGRCVYVKRLASLVLNGMNSIPWKALGSVGESYRFTFTVADIVPGTELICDHFSYRGDIPTSGIEGIYAHGTANTPSILVSQNRVATSEVSSWKAYLSENPIVVVYRIATPIETPLSEEELAAYAALHTSRYGTTVSNDQDAYMDIHYVMDAKKYIDSVVGTGGSSAGLVNATVE